MDKNQLLNHITNPQEKILYAKALDKAFLTNKANTVTYSDFFDPYKLGQLKAIVEGNLSIQAIPFGGYEESERCILGFFPIYQETDNSLFPIDILKISYNTKYSSGLTHRDFLGSILGLGITRDKIGDILIDSDLGYAIAFVHSSISDFIITNLDRVGRTAVKIQYATDFHYEQNLTEKRLTLPSLRLDALLSTAFNVSRGKVADLIKGEKAFVNWNVITSTSKNVCENDIITLRGYGRIKLLEIGGKTKKDRIIVNIAIY